MQVSQRKRLFYDLCMRIQSQCERADEGEPFTAEQALDDAVKGLTQLIQATPKMTLCKLLKAQPCQLEQPGIYEQRVLGWAPDHRMAGGNPGKHKKRKSSEVLE